MARSADGAMTKDSNSCQTHGHRNRDSTDSVEKHCARQMVRLDALSPPVAGHEPSQPAVGHTAPFRAQLHDKQRITQTMLKLYITHFSAFKGSTSLKRLVQSNETTRRNYSEKNTKKNLLQTPTLRLTLTWSSTARPQRVRSSAASAR